MRTVNSGTGSTGLCCRDIECLLENQERAPVLQDGSSFLRIRQWYLKKWQNPLLITYSKRLGIRHVQSGVLLAFRTGGFAVGMPCSPGRVIQFSALLRFWRPPGRLAGVVERRRLKTPIRAGHGKYPARGRLRRRPSSRTE